MKKNDTLKDFYALLENTIRKLQKIDPSITKVEITFTSRALGEIKISLP